MPSGPSARLERDSGARGACRGLRLEQVQAQLRSGKLVRVLEAYAPTVPGYFLYFPSRAQRSEPLRLFVETAKELAAKQGDGDDRFPVSR